MFQPILYAMPQNRKPAKNLAGKRFCRMVGGGYNSWTGLLFLDNTSLNRQNYHTIGSIGRYRDNFAEISQNLRVITHFYGSVLPRQNGFSWPGGSSATTGGAHICKDQWLCSFIGENKFTPSVRTLLNGSIVMHYLLKYYGILGYGLNILRCGCNYKQCKKYGQENRSLHTSEFLWNRKQFVLCTKIHYISLSAIFTTFYFVNQFLMTRNSDYQP